jgi:perosamine synthetase
LIRLFRVAMSSTLTQSVPSMTASNAEQNPLLQTLASGYIGQGPRVDEFEEALQETFGLSRRPVTVNSCTSALDLALELIGVGPGDAVITTPQTCTATNTPIVKRGAIPVWADVDDRGLVTPASVLDAVLAARDAARPIKAIMVVSWAGARPSIEAIRDLKLGLPIIEDAAHRLPSPLNPADYTAWSFQAIKYLTTVDGGALLTPESQYARAKLLRWYGLDRESSADFRCAQDITEVGFKYHMNDVAATIGLANIPMAQHNLRAQRRNARYLAGRLGFTYDETSHYWFFPILIWGDERTNFEAHMLERGIETSQVHARNDKHTGFQQFPRSLPGVDRFDAHQLALPCGWWLTREELDQIAEAVLAFR